MTLRVVLAALACAVSAVCHAQVGSLAVSVTTPEGQPVADAIVIAVPNDPAALANAKPRAEALEQIDKEFVPRVKPVFVGSTVAFPNRDNVRHHVYSFSPARRFELPLYAGMPAQPVLFDKQRAVIAACFPGMLLLGAYRLLPRRIPVDTVNRSWRKLASLQPDFPLRQVCNRNVVQGR